MTNKPIPSTTNITPTPSTTNIPPTTNLTPSVTPTKLPPPTNLPPANFKELSILQLAYVLKNYPKKEPTPEWERVRNYAHKVHCIYINRFNLNCDDYDLLCHLFSNYFNGIVNVWIENDASITKNVFREYLQLILKICTRIRKLRICNKSVTRHTVPPSDINKCTTLETMVFESCSIDELDILKYTNLTAVHLLYCQITGEILNGHFKKIRLIKCKCTEQNQLALIINTRVIKADQLTKELKEVDFQEALQVANELPSKDILLYRLDSRDEFILEIGNFVVQNGPFIGHMIKPLLALETLATPPTTTGGAPPPTTSAGGGNTQQNVGTVLQAEVRSLQGPPQLLHGTEDF